jgi:Photosynthetic reaction centre cytochrome C subunit
MKKLLVLSLITLFVIVAVSFDSRTAGAFQLKSQDSIALEREKYYNEVMLLIKDKKEMNSDSVFKNIKTFTGKQKLSAKHMMWVMNYWGEALGVSCTHCHNPENWASDEKQTKQIAREMFQMRVTINNDILKKINGLQSKEARINCSTCHQGKVIPKK